MNVHHVVFATKYRRMALTEHVFATVVARAKRAAEVFGYELLVIATDEQKPDHVHLLMDLPKSVSVSEAVRNLKWYTSLWTRKQHPQVLQHVSSKALWQRKYFSRSVGGDMKAVSKYIEQQSFAKL